MRNEAELVLMVLECYLKHGPSLSIKELCAKTNISEKRINRILSVLEKREYLAKSKDAGKYMLTKKIAMLV